MHDPVRVLIRGVLLLGLAALHFSAAGADTVRVCVEEANALPDEHGNPIGTQVLREVEKISDLRFVFTQARIRAACLVCATAPRICCSMCPTSLSQGLKATVFF